MKPELLFILCWLVTLPPFSESRTEFLEKLARVCSQVSTAGPPSPILSTPDSAKLVVGNWTLSCQTEGEVVIHNSDGTKVSSMAVLCGVLCVVLCGCLHCVTGLPHSKAHCSGSQ